ncbi:CBS domain-containing protein [Lentibacter sp. XHP0401]|uniref:CBS domain-containing protein n=1 Tax=Lentibacter sp. XHP0401 TaxID=2984334 RepID=UPI0021E7C30F|nr:CBS domain-containing protein [Lentibacter sp. XHP0401]MCV2892082.1 CBS domain-containing protein [Lentibacter sp. XHP0401]
MSKPVIHVSPGSSILYAAELMRDANIGLLPVVESGHAVGVLTDRDIIVRMPSDHCCADLPVRAVMTKHAFTCRDTDPVETAAAIMGDLQIRRLLVLDVDGQIVGVLSVGDIANDASERIAGEVLGEVVEAR